MKLWIFYALMAALSAALVAVFGKIGLRGLDSTAATAARAVIMALFLVGVAAALGKAPLLADFSSRAFLFIVLSGIAGAVSWLFYFSALQRGPASAVAALDRLSVVFVFLLALLVLGEPFTLRAFAGACLMALGAMLMVV